MDKNLVKCFTDAGFGWGGNYSRPDGMHFTLAGFDMPAKNRLRYEISQRNLSKSGFNTGHLPLPSRWQ